MIFSFLKDLSKLTEEAIISEVYTCPFPSEYLKPELNSHLADLGCIYFEENLYGLKDDLQKFLRKNRIKQMPYPTDKWIATRMTSRHTKSGVKNLIHYFIKDHINYAIKIVGVNPVISGNTDVLIIHDKKDKIEDLKYSGVGLRNFSEHRGKNLLFLYYPDDTAGDAENDPNYHYLEEHFISLSTPDELKRGTYVWLIPLHGKGPDKAMYVNRTGYVRICTDAKLRHALQSRDIHVPVGSNNEEKVKNAFEAAVKWVKKQ